MEFAKGRVQTSTGLTGGNMNEIAKIEEQIRAETEEERKAREERGKKQLEEIGYISLKNRKAPLEILDAMESSEGVQLNACHLLGCTVREFRQLLASNPKWGMTWNEIRKKLVSKAECVMVDLLESKADKTKFGAAKYLLDKLGGGEGYGETGAGFEVVVQPGTDDQATRIRAIFGIVENEQGK